jgi:predicted phage terminase large subunit-like protein
LTREEQQFAIALMRESYATYCYFVHKGKWIDTKFHKFLANKVQTFVETYTGNPYDILVLSCPPQHGKSLTVTETFPSWYVGKYPDRRCIIACYNDDFAGKFGRRNKGKIDEVGQFVFDIKLKKSSDRDMEISNHDGSIITRGIMSGITGNSGDLIIIDDPIKNRQEADSLTYRERLWEEWQNSIKTRTQSGTKIIIIQTRWHEDDLSGRVIREENNVEVVNIPVEAEADDILGRPIGDALCPEIGKDNKWLEIFKQSYITDSVGGGIRAWNALYMGRPTSAEGNIFKREWWQYYDKLPDNIPLVGISVDATFKDSDTSDFVAIEVWGKLNGDYYLIDLIKRRMDFPETLRAIKHMNSKYPQRHSILVEDKANGSAIISMLKHELGSIIPITPKESKVGRANAITGIVEGGNVYLPRYADFTNEFVEEFASFPNGAHDDMVDACTQFINHFKFRQADYVEDNRTQFEKDLEKYRDRMLSGRNKSRRSYY